jgi:hypothetical protein
VVDALGPFAQAEEALRRAGRESDPERRAGAGSQRDLDGDRAACPGRDPHADRIAGDRAERRRGSGAHLGDDGVTVAHERGRAGRARPAGGRAVPNRHGAALRDDVGAPRAPRPGA